MDIAELHSRALDATRRVIAGVHQDQWAAPTPCEGWDVRALVNHVVSGNLWAAELAAGKTISDVGEHLDGDVLGADPLGAYDASAKAAAAVFAIPGALTAPCAVSYGPVPGTVYAGHRFIDVLIHGWDVAAATRQDTKLRPALVDACLDIIAPQTKLLHASGAFGDKIELADASDAQTRLLARLGRRGGMTTAIRREGGNDMAFVHNHRVSPIQPGDLSQQLGQSLGTRRAGKRRHGGGSCAGPTSGQPLLKVVVSDSYESAISSGPGCCTFLLYLP